MSGPAVIRPLSAWASLTGLALVGLALIQLLAGRPAPQQLPMLIAAVTGFELFLFVRERLERRGGGGGDANIGGGGERG